MTSGRRQHTESWPCPPWAHPWVTGGLLPVAWTPIWKMKWTFRGRGDGDPVSHHCSPQSPHTEEDVGHLLSTLAARLRLGTLRISTFSGDAALGKADISFEQWYHEVQHVKDHYPESVVWESIIRSLKGAAVDMAQYMGPTTSVAHILRKLLVIFDIVASFNVLMQFL